MISDQPKPDIMPYQLLVDKIYASDNFEQLFFENYIALGHDMTALEYAKRERKVLLKMMRKKIVVEDIAKVRRYIKLLAKVIRRETRKLEGW
ncbi:hypothetical protein [Flagellimonas flava]|uniref:hypothetical protein n=1 Tax=Flagellimonas flava TaxID=570519 RepID=UPI003D64C4BC